MLNGLLCYDSGMLTDDLLDDPIFDSTDGLDEKFFYSIEEELAKRGVNYPSFVEFEKPRGISKVFWDAEAKNYHTYQLDGRWDTLKQVVDALEVSKMEAIFDESINGAPDVDMNMGSMVFLTSGGIVFGASETKVLAYNNFYAFLRTAKSWLQHQDDVVLAFSFIENHPIFWHRNAPETRPFDWVTNGGTKPLWINPAYNKDGLVVMMEIGSTIPPLRQKFYREHRMDVWGSSFEDAYLQIAKKIHSFYSLDGDPR